MSLHSTTLHRNQLARNGHTRHQRASANTGNPVRLFRKRITPNGSFSVSENACYYRNRCMHAYSIVLILVESVIHTCTYVCMHACMHAYMLLFFQVHVCLFTLSLISCLSFKVRRHLACIYAHTHTHIHTHTHTHIYIKVHICIYK